MEISPGSWAGYAAAGLTDDELFGLAEQLVVDGTTSHFEGILPNGLAVASTTFQFFVPSFTAYGADTAPASWPTGMTMTTYGPSTGPVDTSISIIPLATDTRILLGLTHTLTDLGNGTIAATTPDDRTTSIYSQRDGHEIWARSSSLDPETLGRLVLSLSPATDAEWANLRSGAPSIAGGGFQPTETTAIDYPTATGPQLPNSANRSTVTLDYTPLDGGTMTAVLPEDQVLAVQFEPIGRSLRIIVAVDDTEVYSGDLDVNDSAGASGGSIAGEGNGLYVFTYSTIDPAVTRLSVIDGTTEYTAPYINFDNSSAVRVAVVVVPARTGRTAPPAEFNLDINGNDVGNI